MKGKTSTTHKNMVEAIQKKNVALVEYINHIHEVNLQIEENCLHAQERQLEYFKQRNIAINQMQQRMVEAIVGLVETMALAFKRNTKNNVPPGSTSSVEHEKTLNTKNMAHVDGLE
jgi:translation elongation factor EF-G